MAWSTREVAEIAGTTVKAVRHYHAVGLLAEPERLANGYKRYTTTHLLRILQIRRLSELGVPLAQVAAMGAPSQEPEQVIRMIDADLASTIERLQRIRAELAIVARHGAALAVPADFASLAGSLSDPDQALLIVLAQLFDKEATDDFRAMMERGSDVDQDFDALPPDASDEQIDGLATRLLPSAVSAQGRPPWNAGVAARFRPEIKNADRVLGQAIVDLYNPAQVKVLVRLSQLVVAETGPRSRTRKRHP